MFLILFLKQYLVTLWEFWHGAMAAVRLQMLTAGTWPPKGLYKLAYTTMYCNVLFCTDCTLLKRVLQNYDGILNNRTCAVKYHIIKSESPNLQVSSSAS